MSPKSYKEQKSILATHFPNLSFPKLKEDKYFIPHWKQIDATYSGAVQKILDAIKSTRPFYNWREGKIDESHLRQTDRKIKAWEGKEYLSIDAQLGEKYKGKSVTTARKLMEANEFGLGWYEMGIILLTHPDVLTSYDDLWIDCPGDEFSPDGDGEFSEAPSFGFSDGRLRTGAGDVDGASGYFGSASSFVPQPLETGNIEPSESLSIESAIKLVKEAGYIIYKQM